MKGSVAIRDAPTIIPMIHRLNFVILNIHLYTLENRKRFSTYYIVLGCKVETFVFILNIQRRPINLKDTVFWYLRLFSINMFKYFRMVIIILLNIH